MPVIDNIYLEIVKRVNLERAHLKENVTVWLWTLTQIIVMITSQYIQVSGTETILC